MIARLGKVAFCSGQVENKAEVLLADSYPMRTLFPGG